MVKVHYKRGSTTRVPITAIAHPTGSNTPLNKASPKVILAHIAKVRAEELKRPDGTFRHTHAQRQKVYDEMVEQVKAGKSLVPHDIKDVSDDFVVADIQRLITMHLKAA